MQHTAQHLATPPASHLPSHGTASAISPQIVRHLAACHPLAPEQHPSTLCMPSARQFTARYPPAQRKPSAVVLHNIWRPPASHPPSHGTASFDPASHPLAPCRHLPARTDALNDPQNKSSARTGSLNPRKSMFCVIVNCPLQIKPVFYFLFTSIASSAHRIRVKSSLLRLGRSCLALPFTHLGKDIT